ncbi:MAG: hypothetical protein ACRDPT_05780 [Streptomycetales bacterium]
MRPPPHARDSTSTTRGRQSAVLPRWAMIALATAMSLVWAGTLWVTPHLDADPALHTAALFVHLASLVVGFGAVLTVDWIAVLWLLDRRTLNDLSRTISGTHIPIWVGLIGLLLSGTVLGPHLDSSMTQLKLGLVLVVALNGVQAWAVYQQLVMLDGRPVPRSLLLRCAATALTSQLGWWGATIIGFANHQA